MDGVIPKSRKHEINEGSVTLDPQPSEEAVLEELERIFSSHEFRNADVQRSFLRYVVEHTLKGYGDQIKEYTIGLEVFHRDESFDPRRDNIVRDKARRLRKTLARYYEEEGIADPVRIEFRPGSYQTVFRTSPAPGQVDLSSAKTIDAVDAKPAGTSAAVGGITVPSKTAVSDPEGHRASPPPLTSRRLIWPMAAAFLIILVLATVGYLATRARSGLSSSATPSIAVLPFRLLNNDQAEEFFSDGLTGDLIDSLAKIPGIRVVGPTSAFLYKGKDIDVRKVGRELNVGAVLEGTVRRVDDRLRITAQLSDAGSGLHRWSSSYDREVKDVLGIQREISTSITNALGVTLARPAPRTAERADVLPNTETYDDYLKGRYFWSKNTLGDFETAIGYFQRAIAKDPSYAPSYAGLAHCYSAIPAFANFTPPDTVPKIRETALKALSLDSTLGEAHVDLATAYNLEHEWSKAEQEYRKALELSPGVALVHARYGAALTRMKRFQEALAEYREALSLDPVSPSASASLGRPLYFMRRYDEALKQYREALELDPNSATIHEYMGIVYVMKGMRSEGIGEFEIAHNEVRDSAWYSGLLGWADAIAGKTAAANEILDTLIQRSAHDPSPARAIAHIYIGLGKRDQAFQWLRKAIDSGNSNMTLLSYDPMYDPLRNDPRFADLLRRLSLL